MDSSFSMDKARIHYQTREIMKILVEESPTTIEEYHDAVPHYLIVGSDPEQAREYTSKIIETIRACVKGKK